MRRVILICAAVAMVTGCTNTPYKRIATALNTLAQTKLLFEQFDAAVKNFVVVKRAECKTKHAVKTAEYDQCILPAIRLARAWTGEKNGVATGKGALPILQRAQKAAAIALFGAYDYVKSNEAACAKADAPKECHGDWEVLLKPGACAAWQVVDIGVKLGAFSATENKYYKLVGGAINAFACGG